MHLIYFSGFTRDRVSLYQSSLLKFRYVPCEFVATLHPGNMRVETAVIYNLVQISLRHNYGEWSIGMLL